MTLPKNLKSFLSDSATYTLLNLVNKSIPFILLPIVIRMVSSEDFGYYSLFITVETLLIPIVTLNMPAALSIHYYADEINLNKYLSTIIIALFTVTFFFFLIMMIIPESIIRKIGLPSTYVMTTIFTASAIGLINMMANLFRLQRRPWIYGIFVISQSILLLTLIIVFCLLQPNFFMLTVGRIVYAIFFLITSIIILYNSNLLSISFNKLLIRKILKFSIPTVFYSISAFIFLSSDRFLIQYFCGVKEVAHYSALYQLASVISILGMSLNAAWMPWLFENLKKNDMLMNIFIVKLSYYLIVTFLIVGIIFCFIFPYVAKVILPFDYYNYTDIAYPIIFGFVFEAIYLIVSPYTFYVEKTKYNGFIGLIVAIFNVSLNIFLIPIIGIKGSAYSSLFSWILLSILFFIFSFRVYPMPWFSVHGKK